MVARGFYLQLSITYDSEMQFLTYIYIYFSAIYRLLTKLREPQREFRLVSELEIGEWWALWLGDRYSDSDLLGLITAFVCSDSLNTFMSS